MLHQNAVALYCCAAFVVAANLLASATAAGASSEDEPLLKLFDSFFPKDFLERPVAGQPGSAKMGKDERADSAQMMKTAEAMMSGLRNIVDGLNAPDNGDCKFACANGAEPKHRPGFQSVPNGCGTHGFKADTSDLPGITECCNRHDICYGTCNSGQRICDQAFNQCMADACNTMQREGPVQGKEELKECRAIGAAFHLAAMSVGCEFYRDAQRAACLCDKAGFGGGSQDSADQAQEKIRQFNSEKRARESQADQEATADEEGSGGDPLDSVDMSSPVFDLPDAIDHTEL